MNSQRSHTYVRAVNNLNLTTMGDGASGEEYWKGSGTITSNHKNSPYQANSRPMSPTYNANSLSRNSDIYRSSDGNVQQQTHKKATSPPRIMNGEAARLAGPSKAFTQVTVSFELHGLRDPGNCRLKVVNPRDEFVPCNTKRDDHGLVLLMFKGTVPGLYVITASVDDQMIEGSPAKCDLQDLSNIRCQVEHDPVALGDTVTLVVDLPKQSLKQLGPNKPLMSSEASFVKDGRQEPCTVESFTQGKSSTGAHWKVLLRPQEPGQYEIRPMLNGCLLPGSPYECHVVDVSKIRVNGPGLVKTGIDQDAWFQIHLPEDAPERECHTFIYEPKSGTETKSKASNSKKPQNNLIYVCRSINNLTPVAGERELLCQYKAKMTGPHEIHVNYLNRPVPGSPWICHVFDASKVKLIQKPNQPVPLGQPVNLLVDCRDAGRGDLQAIVNVRSSPELEIPMFVKPEDESQHIIRCSFQPQDEGEHLVHITFNGQHVSGSPCSVFVSSPQPSPPVAPPIEERMPIRSAASTLQKSMAPSSHTSAQYSARPLRVGVPSELRFHQMSNRPDTLGPEARPDDLRPAIPSDGLKAIVRGPYQETVPHQILVSPSRNAHLVEFCPRTVGEHQIEVFHNGQPVEGNPFKVRVYDPNKVMVSMDRTVPVGKEARIRIDSREAGHVPLDVSVDPPPGHKDLDTHLRPTEGGFSLRYWVFGYTPAEPGVYRIHVYYGDVPVPGSPFEQHAVGHHGITDTMAEGSIGIPHATSPTNLLPRVYGEGLTRAVLGQKSRFVVDPKGQKGELYVQVEGPNSMAQCNIARDPANPNTYLVEYVPTEVGEYVIHMNWQNQPVEGSPFYTVVVAPDTVRCISDPEVHYREPIHAPCLKNRQLVFDASQAGPGVLTAEVLDGKHLNVPSEVKVNNTNSHMWTLSFTPQVKGRYRVNVWWEGIRLPDCPITVEAFGPPGSEGSISHRRSSRLYIQEQQPLQTAEPDHTKVILMGRGLRECVVGHSTEFTIDGHKAGVGRPRVSLSDNQGVDIPMSVFNEGHQRYTCSYTVEKPGSYFLNILWGDRHVRGTPFKVTARRPGDNSHGSISSRSSSITNLHVQKSQARSPTPTENATLQRRAPQQRSSNEILTSISPEPQLVSGIRVWGDGLQEAVVNRVARVFIDVTKLMESRGRMSATPPAISAQCMGPRGVPAVCEVKETTIPGHFEVHYTPQEIGTHELFLYCDGVVLRYCPYRIRVATSSDPHKVRVYGPGVEWGVLENYESRFICDTRGAGAGQLTVKIKGKQGAFRVELERENQQDRGIVCRYDPTEPGDYYITVKWSGNQVPGSPFHVRIFETAEEYENYMRTHPYDKEGSTNFRQSTSGQKDWHAEV